ncbi:MAG TPA: DNA polymerase ligase N-terminal domain-containing protein, partial [Steroidobacteraceae bacterium]|nr:DNA polymerase ligase N-terminal domain-containing protein [Steroidobacteraceae bacterium]
MASKKLSTYRAKRDFAVTAEPSGKLPVESSNRLRYVIQKHAARRLHFDLRLELGGVFKSWAVTRGPSVDPKDKRLAVEVEDHPLDYGDFEGTIPQGQYGGGTVQLWDRGYWEPEGNASPETQLKKGELKFRLDGGRLQGSWVIVRMKGDRYGGKRTNWLMIKHRDEHAGDAAAVETMMGEDRSIASDRAMAQIEAGKGRGPKPFMLKTELIAKADAVWNSNRGEADADETGPATGAVEKVAPRGKRGRKKAASKTTSKTSSKTKLKSKALPAFVEPELCKVLDRPPVGERWAHEIKFDGYRVQLRVADGSVTLKTRKGLDWTEKFAATARAAAGFPDCIIDGEIVALDTNGSPDFGALQAALAERDSDNLVFFAFDLLFAEDQDCRPLTLEQRKKLLKTLLDAHANSSIRFVDHFQTAGDAVLQSACRMNLEGIISKRLDSKYLSGRNGDWTKSKCR